jgi:hypothetical protein
MTNVTGKITTYTGIVGALSEEAIAQLLKVHGMPRTYFVTQATVVAQIFLY